MAQGSINSKPQEFIGLLFLSRDFAHKAHLNSKSFSEHKALDKFYHEIIDLADDFVEAWQGRNQELIGEIPQLEQAESSPLEVLKRHLAIIEDIRTFVPQSDTALNNIIDEIVALYLSTLYKLKFLK